MLDEIDTLREMVDRVCRELGEHADSVRIFVTLHSGDGTTNTRSYEAGTGNFYAQLGQVREWIAIQDQYQRNWAIRKDAESPD